MLKSVLITGANAGLGKESARQLALLPEIEKVYLGCRNMQKAEAAKQDLESRTGRTIFEIVQMDVTDLKSVEQAVSNLKSPVDGLIMNAGGTGGKNFYESTPQGVTQIVAVNLLGHVALMDALLKTNKLRKVAIYSGSEAARGVKEMGMKQPHFNNSSVEEFIAVCEGKLYGHKKDATVPYGPVKYMGALWMSSLARQHQGIRFVTMSPGGTTGTEGLNALSPGKKLFMKTMMHMMLMLGKVHKLETGAKRYIDALMNNHYLSGKFYASKKGISGPIDEQGTLFRDLTNPIFQNNARAALQSFLKT